MIYLKMEIIINSLIIVAKQKQLTIIETVYTYTPHLLYEI